MTVPGGAKYKLGRQIGPSTTIPHGKLMLRDYLVGGLPPYHGSDDFTTGITNWGGELGNDSEGDCVECADTSIGVVTAILGGEMPAASPVWPTTEDVLATYWAQGIAAGEPGPEPDQGTDAGSYLLWRMKNPLGALPPLGGVAQIDITDNAEFEAAFHIFGGGLACINVSQEAMNQAEADPPHPWTSLATDWIGGHGVHMLARDRARGVVRTWGFLQSFDWGWWRVAREQFFVEFTAEMMAAPNGIWNGIAVAQLKSDIVAMGGTA